MHITKNPFNNPWCDCDSISNNFIGTIIGWSISELRYYYFLCEPLIRMGKPQRTTLVPFTILKFITFRYILAVSEIPVVYRFSAFLPTPQKCNRCILKCFCLRWWKGIFEQIFQPKRDRNSSMGYKFLTFWYITCSLGRCWWFVTIQTFTKC